MIAVNPETNHWSAAGYAQHAHFVPALGEAVFDLLHARPGERILDLGCGDGVLSGRIAALGVELVGVDSSPDMVEAARRRGIDARLIDGERLPFQSAFDAVFSNAALHWMKQDPDAVIAGIHRSLKAGGRFVGELGGHGCVAAISVAIVAALERRGVQNAERTIPWFFPTAEEYRARLERGGFIAERVDLIPRPTLLPTGMRGWLHTFAVPFTVLVPEPDRDSFLDEVVARLAPVLCDSRGQWTADYMRLRFVARKAG